MNTKELRQKTPTELEHLLAEMHDSLRTLRFKVGTQQLKGVRDIRETRKTIARILTLLMEYKAKNV